MMHRLVRGLRRRRVVAGGLSVALLALLAIAIASGAPAVAALIASSISIAIGVAFLAFRAGPLATRGARRSEGEDARMRALLHSTLESTTDGILTVDLKGTVVSHNQRFLEMWQLEPSDVEPEGRNRLVRALDRLADPESFLERVQELRAAPEATGTDLLEFRDGRTLHRTTQPHRLGDRIVGRVWSFRDITEQRRTETALAESERRFRRMVTNVPGVIYQFYVRRDNVLWFTYLSEGCQALLGVEPGGFPWRADTLVSRVHDDDMRTLREVVARAAAAMESWTWEGRVTLKSGVTKWLRAASRPTRHPDGKISWDGLLMDVTEEKTAVEALHRREEQLAEAQEIAHVGSWDWDVENGMVVISPEHWRIFGYEPDGFKWSFEHYIRSVHPDDREMVKQRLRGSMKSGAASSIDYRIVQPDGTERFVSSRGKVIKNSQGSPVRIVGTVQDVTGRRDAAAALERRVGVEQALTRAARLLSASSSEDIEKVLELIGTALGADRAYLCQSRPDADALLMDSTHEWCADGVPPAIDTLQGIDTAAAPWWMDQLMTKSSTVIHGLDELPPEAVLERQLLEMNGVCATAAVPLSDGRVGLIGFLGFDYVKTRGSWSEEDVRVLQTTAEMLVAYFSRVKAEKEVVRREGILQAVSFAAGSFLRAPDWEAGLDEALALIGGAAGVSRAYLFQTRAGEDGSILVGQRAEWVAEGIEPQMGSRGFEFASLHELGLGRWEQLFRNRQPLQAILGDLPEYERLCLAAQGIRSVLQLPIFVGDEWWGTLGIDHCLEEREWSHTEVEALRTAAGMIAAAVQRKRSEEALRESEERFRQMAESMREVFFMVSVGTNEVIYLSPSYEDVWGRPRSDSSAFVDSILAEDRHILHEDMALSQTGDGDPLRFIEYRIARPDGSIRWIRHRTFQILDEEGRPYRVTGVCSDITEQKQLEEELRRANRIEAIGHLAAGVAHEINTPIQYIGDNVRFLNDSYTDVRLALDAYRSVFEEAASGGFVAPERIAEVAATLQAADVEYLLDEAPRATAQALDGVERVAEIVRAMKEFSHPGSGQKVPTDLNQAIRSTTTVARNEWKYVAELVTNLDESLPPVACLPGELNQAILNLVVNAAHAIADRQQADRTDQLGFITVSTAAAGDYVEIRVSDTGTGIPNQIRGQVFDPFFTTKEVGRGTGQGLTFVHSIVVDKHGGTVGFETEPGIGTTFIVRLPQGSSAPGMSEAA